MVLRAVENRLERLFERTFSRSFSSGLQPVEIATRIVREIDLTRQLSAEGPLSPNDIKVWLGPRDAARFDGFQAALVRELEETVRQHALAEGYNFVGPVAVHVFVDDDVRVGAVAVETAFVGGEREPRLLLDDGRSFVIAEKPLIVGRSPVVPVVINDANVSRQHAEFWRTTDGVAVRDLHSTNGTFVNGHRVSAVSLSPRDDVTIGPIHLRIELV